MSKENPDYDVRVVLYDSTKANIAQIVFFNDIDVLLECERVKIVRDGDRLYFHKGDAVSGSIKLSGLYKNILQIQKDFDKVKDLEGIYDVKHDNKLDMFYIDRNERLADYDGHKYFMKGVKQLNHNAGEREERGEIVMAAQLTEKGRKVVEAHQKEVARQSVTPTEIVIKALVALLKTQVEGNIDALTTIEALEKFI